MDVIYPHMLVDGDREAMEFQRNPGTYDDTLTSGNRYVEGDLVEVNSSGKVQKAVGNAAAVEGKALFIAGQSWDQPFALGYLMDKGVPLNVIPAKNRFVFTYQGDAADNAAYTFASGDLLAVEQNAQKDIAYNSVEGCLTVRDTSANPKCTLKGVFKGEVGDDNVRVIVELMPEAL